MYEKDNSLRMESQARGPCLSIPQSMRDINRWINWRPVERDGKTAKMPWRGSKAIDAQDPENWLTFNDAYKTDPQRIGIVFSDRDGLVGIDLDKCVQDGEITDPSVEDLVNSLETYTEISPSGTGLHIYGFADSCHKGINTGKIEMYSSGRFFTVTGNKYDFNTVEVITTGYKKLLAEHHPVEKPAAPFEDLPTGNGLTDEQVLNKMCESKNGTATDLMAGKWEHLYDSQSQADLGLCNLLAFWTAKNFTQIDRIFRTSGLMRDKWDSKRGSTSIGDMCIHKAILGTKDTYSPTGDVPTNPIVEKGPDSLLSALKNGADVEVKPISWLWKPLLARGKFHLLAARGGSFKTSITCDIAARVTTGATFPGIEGYGAFDEKFKKGSVLFVTTEDDPGDTLKPRFLAAGGDPSRITFLSSSDYHLDLNEKPEELGQIIESLPDDLSLVVLDPVTSMTGDANTHIDSNVKRLSGLLSGLAIHYNLTMLGIIHFKKGNPTAKDNNFVDMVTGSAGWVNSSRITNACLLDEKTDTGYLGVIKSNIGPSKFTVEYKAAIKNEIVTLSYKPAERRSFESISRELAARDRKESGRAAKVGRAINRYGDFFRENGMEPAEVSSARNYVRMKIGDRITDTELKEAEDGGSYKKQNRGKGHAWLIHAPGCVCSYCLSDKNNTPPSSV